MAKKRLSREDILNAKDIVQEEVYVKEWGGGVLVQSLSGQARSELFNYAMNDKGKLDTMKLYPAMMVSGVIEPEFSRADAEAILSKSASALEKVCQAIMRLSGIGEDDVIDEAEKNS